MSQAEFLRWVEFYKLYPFDDMHRFYRPAAMVAQATGGADMQKLLDWLQPDPRNADMDDADMNTLRALGFKTKA